MPRSSQSRTGPAGVTPGPSSAWPVGRPSCSAVLRGGLISGCVSQQSTSPPLAVLKGNHPVCTLFLWLLFCIMFVRYVQVMPGYGSFILLEAWSLNHWNYQGNPWFIYFNCQIIHHWMTLPNSRVCSTVDGLLRCFQFGVVVNRPLVSCTCPWVHVCKHFSEECP